MKKRVGVFGGTFNPVHNGHIGLARWLVERGVFDEVLLTLSPANPLKNDRPGASDADRRRMLELACNDIPAVNPCFIEFDMPRPSFTIATLRRLQHDCPGCCFSLVVGADNWLIFDRWRSPREIIADFGVTVYPRPGYEVGKSLPDGVRYLADAPVCNVSSSDIRRSLATNSSLLPQPVANYIKDRKLYDYAGK